MQRADFAIGGITLTLQRMEAVKYSVPHYINSVTFTTALPESKGYSSSLLGPFEDRIWFSLLAALLLVFILSPALEINWSLIPLLLSQPIIPSQYRTLPLKALIGCWLFTALVLKNYYSGEIFGLMTRISELDSIETIEEFEKVLLSGKVKVITIGNSTFYMPKLEVIYHGIFTYSNLKNINHN